MHTIGEDRLLSIAEVATKLGCSKASVYRRVRAGELPASRLGDGLTPFRISERELVDWLEAHRLRSVRQPSNGPDAA
jgi:excisionase family DNA binding protein